MRSDRHLADGDVGDAIDTVRLPIVGVDVEGDEVPPPHCVDHRKGINPSVLRRSVSLRVLELHSTAEQTCSCQLTENPDVDDRGVYWSETVHWRIDRDFRYRIDDPPHMSGQ